MIKFKPKKNKLKNKSIKQKVEKETGKKITPKKPRLTKPELEKNKSKKTTIKTTPKKSLAGNKFSNSTKETIDLEDKKNIEFLEKGHKKNLKSKGGLGVPKPFQLDEKVKQKTNQYRFLTMRMYSYKFFNWLLKGSVDDRDPNLNGDNIQIGYSEIFTKSTVTRYYVVSFLGEDTPVGFMNYLIKEVKTGKYWVNLSMQIKNKPYTVDFSQTHLNFRLQTWQKILNGEDSENGNDTGEIIGKDGKVYVTDFEKSTLRKKTARMFRSYYKIRENVGHVKESVIILKLQTKDKDSMILADKRLRSALMALEVDFYQITGTLLDFLRAMSPISKKHTVSNDTVNRVLLTARDIADLMPYRQGKIGNKGIWFGIDKYSGSSVWLDIMNTPQAKNILLMGLTGAGKSFYMSMLILFHHAMKHNIFIHDHKGNEFTHFARAVGGVVISMTPSKTSFLNTFAIPVEDVETESELRGLFTEAYSLSELVFLTLTEPEEHEIRDYKNLFNDFMTHCYRAVGVIQNQVETYSKSKQLTPNRLYELYTEFSGPQSTGVIEAYGEKMLLNIKVALHRYWHPKGSRHELFLNEIDMNEIKKNKVVCFDFGMAETTRESVPKNEEKLKKIFMNVAASRFVNQKKKMKEWTVKVVEEIQSADEDILKFTSADITEGRAKNMINYVLGNATGSLTSDSQYAKNIIENMNIQILGKLAKNAREFYINQYDLHGMREDLELIAKDDKDYKYCFLLNCNITEEPATAIVQAVTTKRVAESKFFRTVDYGQDEGENEGKLVEA